MKKKIKIGTWITTYNPQVANLMSFLGFYWICIDMEHSVIKPYQMEILISIIQKNKSKAFVRVGKNDSHQIKQALDSGADGIIVPMVNSVEDATKSIDNTFYPPVGKRGVGLYTAQMYGFESNKYFKIANKKIKLILQIESKVAVDNLEKILNLKHISGTLIGPYDLSASLNLTGKLNHPLMKKYIQKYERICKSKKIPMGIHIASPNLNDVKKYKKKYSFLAAGTDIIFLGNSCKNFLEKISF